MKKPKRGTPRRRRRTPAKPRTTIIKALRRQPPPIPDLPIGLTNATPTLLGDPMITSAFVGTLKLTADQIKALRRPVDDTEVEWKPAERDGPPVIPYLSHNGYRDRLDAAFGLGGWGMVPVSMPRVQDSTIYTAYALVVDGMPRVYAWGEQALHKMSYGDGIEGAKSNAITRCGKELGIGRELWNRGYIAELKKRKHPMQTFNAATGNVTTSAEPDTRTITEPQKIRLWTIVKKTGRPKHEVVVWLTGRYGITDSLKILRRDYASIIEQIEAQGPLTLPPDPGEGG